MKSAFIIYSVQISGSIFSKGDNSARRGSLNPFAVVFTQEEAEFCCKENKEEGFISFYIEVPVLSWSKSVMKRIKAQRNKK